MITLLLCAMLDQLHRPTTATQVQQVQTQGQGSWQRWADSVDAKFGAVDKQFKAVEDYRDKMTEMGTIVQQEIEGAQDQIEDLKNKIKAMQLHEQEKERAKAE